MKYYIRAESKNTGFRYVSNIDRVNTSFLWSHDSHIEQYFELKILRSYLRRYYSIYGEKIAHWIFKIVPQ